MNETYNRNIAYKVSFNTIILNIILTVIKLIAGIFGHSNAMVSDAIHSASDVFSTIVVIIGIKISNKEADKEHPYGHEKFECIASFLLSLFLFVTAIFIGFSGVLNIIKYTQNIIIIPSIGALWAAVLSIVLKEFMYHYTKKAAKKINSSALLADAWHHRSDAISSVGALIGVGFSRIGYPIFDPIVSISICILIIKVAFDISKTSISQLTDTAAPLEVENEIINIINKFNEVYAIDMIKTRLFGNKIYVDIELQIDKNMTLEKSHKIIQNIHDEIEKKNRLIKHCMIHTNPTK